MTAGKGSKDPALSDRLWIGYHPLAMAPVGALTTITSLVVWTGHWYLDGFSEFAETVGGWAMFALTWAVWPALLGVFLYRTITFTYRLTDRAVLVDFGLFYRPVPALLLKDVNHVVVGWGGLTRWLRVGWVEIRLPDRAIRMKGVRHPSRFAVKVREAVAAARAAQGE